MLISSPQFWYAMSSHCVAWFARSADAMLFAASHRGRFSPTSMPLRTSSPARIRRTAVTEHTVPLTHGLTKSVGKARRRRARRKSQCQPHPAGPCDLAFAECGTPTTPSGTDPDVAPTAQETQPSIVATSGHFSAASNLLRRLSPPHPSTCRSNPTAIDIETLFQRTIPIATCFFSTDDLTRPTFTDSGGVQFSSEYTNTIPAAIATR